MGALRSDHVRTLRREHGCRSRRLVSASDLSGWSMLDREMFEAESWALCHYLLISEERRGEGQADLARLRALLADGAAPGDAASATLGDGLQTRVFRHVTARELDSFTTRIQRVGSSSTELRDVPVREVLEELGSLSLAIGALKQGSDYYDRVLELDASSASANAGMGDALVALNDLDGAQAHYQTALDAAPDDPLVQLGAGHVSLARARATGDAAARAELVRDARDHYQRSLALAGSLPEAYAGLARTHLIDGEDADAATQSWESAHELLPGDAALESLGVELALARGDRDEARRLASRLHTRARGTTEVADADALLGRIDARADAR